VHCFTCDLPEILCECITCDEDEVAEEAKHPKRVRRKQWWGIILHTGRAKEAIMAKKKKKAAKRELIDTGRDKRYVRRDKGGQFKESDDQVRSLSQDRKKKAKRKVNSGQGDKGDR
jgi:hypothetical protein